MDLEGTDGRERGEVCLFPESFPDTIYQQFFNSLVGSLELFAVASPGADELQPSIELFLLYLSFRVHLQYCTLFWFPNIIANVLNYCIFATRV